MSLTLTHRKAQLALRASVISDLRKIWPAMDWTDLDLSFPTWSTAVGVLIGQRRQTSAGIAAAYYRALRFSKGLTDSAPIQLARPVSPERLNAVLRVTAYAGVKAAATRGVGAEQAMANAFVRSAGAASRLVLEGGRETIQETTRADPRARGWRRVTGGRSCSFCSSLAAQGGIYGESADFQAHDHCGCSAEPAF